MKHFCRMSASGSKGEISGDQRMSAFASKAGISHFMSHALVRI
jgi:hypothetical protein